MDLQRGFLLSIILSLVYITFRMMQPFLGYLLVTVMLAFVLYPLQKKLEPKIGARVSAFLLVIFILLVAVIPFALTVNAVISDAQQLDISFNQTDWVNTTDLEKQIKELTGRDIDIEQRLETVLSNFVTGTLGSVSKILDILTNVSIGVTISLFVLFYLLKDGKGFKSWLMKTTPMPQEIQQKLYDKTYRTTWAVVKGHVIVALVQGTIAGLGLFFVGIESAAFWTFIMILLAFLPLVGAFLVWGPAGLYLIATGQVGAGIFLMIWGTVIVGLTDNFLRPLLVDRGTELHPAVILIGVIGGIYVFGAAGIFMGPIALGVLKAVLEVFRNNYNDL